MALEPVFPLQVTAKTFHTDEVFGRKARLKTHEEKRSHEAALGEGSARLWP
jgi:hypothetical protein